MNGFQGTGIGGNDIRGNNIRGKVAQSYKHHTNFSRNMSLEPLDAFSDDYTPK